MNLVEFVSVSKSFCDENKEIEVLKDLSFSLKEGEKIAFVGPSGCGKSTILNIISKLTEIDKGEVSVKGNVGYMFQTDNLFEWRTVYKNITLGLEINGKIKKEDLRTGKALKTMITI
jgi:NitT/TauT family transport system ATP-binding protein